MPAALRGPVCAWESCDVSHSPLPPEPPATLAHIDAKLNLLITRREIDANKLDELGLDMRHMKDERELERRERRRLQAVAGRLSNTVLKLAAAKALSAIAPTPAHVAMVLGASFVGGLFGHLLLSWAHAIQSSSVALLGP